MPKPHTFAGDPKQFVLLLWAISSLLPYYIQFVSPTILGTCSWNAFGMLYYFAGYSGYLLLGHYLHHRTWSIRKVALVGTPMFLIGYFITYFGREYMLGIDGCTENMAELFWTNNSLNVIMMVIPLFMLCKVIHIRSERTKALLANLTKCGYGIYMIHYFFIGYAVICMRWMNVPLGLQIPLAGVLTLSVSWFLSALGHHLIGKTAKWILG